MRAAWLSIALALALLAGEPTLAWLPPAEGAPSSRQALLLVADEYAESAWNLPGLAENARALRQGLLAAGWSPSAISELSGARVHSDAIRAALRRAAARLAGEAPLLLVYYTGHGYSTADGTPALCTSATQELPGGGLSATIPVPELVAWVAAAFAEQRAAQAVIVIDACRNQRTLAPPPPITVQPLPIWQVYSTDSGRFAPAPSGGQPSPFTAAFARALAMLAAEGQDVGVRRLVEQVRLDLQQRQIAPLPVLVAGSGSVEPCVLRQPRAIPVRLSALHAESGAVLPRVRVQVDGVACDPENLLVRPGLRRWTVFASGFRPVDGSLQIPDDEAHGTVVARLRPWLTRRGEDRALLELEGLQLRFRRIAAHSLRLGSPPEEAGRQARSEGQRTVDIGAFWIAEHETTQRLWQAVMGSNPSQFKGEERPVESVSWHDVQRFLEALAARCPGLEPRLPSEAEWEAACRAGTFSPWSFGSDAAQLPRYANYADRRLAESDPDPDRWPGADLLGDDGYGAQTAPVGRFSPNPWGLYDMHGNVAEWCQDVFAADPAQAPAGGERAPRSVRGGSWASPPFQTRSAARIGLPPHTANPTIGFRLVVASPPASP
ncbi:MAG: formylglycine-generating enzyme family protein [Planctomycetota bacterium]|nr:formylglycine-generating enzyme family protein [Planctomycetota bacterium]